MGHTDTVQVDPSKWTFPPFSADARRRLHLRARHRRQQVAGGRRHDDHAAAEARQRRSRSRRDFRRRSRRGSVHRPRHRTPGQRPLVRHRRRSLSSPNREAWSGATAKSATRWSKPPKSCRRERAWWPTAPPATARAPCAPARFCICRRPSKKSRLWDPPMRFNDTTRAYFEKLATIGTPDEAARYNGSVRSRESRRQPRISGRARPRQILHAAHFDFARHHLRRLPDQRDSVAGRGHAGYSRPAG